ncbi:MAG: TIGR01777 family protein [Deltaproteobacteria bacterium]|nr:MAG: TIGR01777 family protein [Deltaproteobacteria bacterium]
MKITITGGTGFIGTYLTRFFIEKGHLVTTIGTRTRKIAIHPARYDHVLADTRRSGRWQASVAKADMVINLAGKSILKRWNKAYKKEIYDSRILTTRHLVAALPREKPVVLFSASAVGYYGNRGDDIIIENEGPSDDFLGRVCRDWENEAMVAEQNGHRVVRMRLGVVFGEDGGAFQQMAKVFRRFAGGPVGTGRQWFPWIHIQDVAGAIHHILGKADLDGAFNFCVPHPPRNRDVARAFGYALNRPAGLAAPSFMLRLVLGEFAETLLAGQQAVPDRLIRSGFVFRFPELDQALTDLVA